MGLKQLFRRKKMNVKVFTPKQILSGSGMSTVKQILLLIVAIEKGKERQ
jgi:hypothetical protein